MIYALNVFNLIPGKEDEYRDYSVQAGRIIYGLGGKVISAGAGPLREMHGDCTRLGCTHTVVSLHNDRIGLGSVSVKLAREFTYKVGN